MFISEQSLSRGLVANANHPESCSTMKWRAIEMAWSFEVTDKNETSLARGQIGGGAIISFFDHHRDVFCVRPPIETREFAAVWSSKRAVLIIRLHGITFVRYKDHIDSSERAGAFIMDSSLGFSDRLPCSLTCNLYVLKRELGGLLASSPELRTALKNIASTALI